MALSWVEWLIASGARGYIVCEGQVLSPKGWRVRVSKHGFAVFENALRWSLLVDIAAADLDVRMMRGKVVPLVALILRWLKVLLMLSLVVPLVLRHDSKLTLSSEGLLLLLLLLEVMAEQEHRNEAERENDGLFGQRMGDTAYAIGREDALEVVPGEELNSLSQRQAERLSQLVIHL